MSSGTPPGRLTGARVIGDRWGATEAETLRRYPCDEIVAEPAMRAWRAVTAHAAPEQVWPWVCQVRLAPYSYDWIDNRGRRSPQRLVGLSEPVAGEPFTAVGGRPLGRIIAVTPGEQLTGEVMGAVMSYVLVAQHQSTRLLLKVVARTSRAAAPLLCLGDLIMARRQLLNLARLAEQTTSRDKAGYGRTTPDQPSSRRRADYAAVAFAAMTLVMYVKPGCPYCQHAREHFQAAGEQFEERDATTSEVWKAELMGYTNNRGLVPTIVRDGVREQVGFPPGRG